MADLKDGSLERALALLAANDVTDLVTLRRSFTSLASELRKGPRALISRATRSLQLVPSVGRSSRASSSRAHGAVARDARGPRRAQPRRVNMHIGCSPDCKRCDVMSLAESEWAIDNSVVVSHFLNLRSASRD